MHMTEAIVWFIILYAVKPNNLYIIKKVKKCVKKVSKNAYKVYEVL